MPDTKPYTDQFFEQRHTNTQHAATRVLSLVLDVIPKLSSAVDIGCGVGTWLSVLKEKGINDIQGVDGEWVNQALLEIPSEQFLSKNVAEGVQLQRRFDLAISLEVAEHLPPQRADPFIQNLIDLADFVLFSAAIPFQGGTNHVNEQWPEYWSGLFKAKGYVGLDIVRRMIWNDPVVPYYYKQNTLFYAKQSRLKELNLDALPAVWDPIPLVHPETYLFKINKYTSLKGSWKAFRRALKQHLIKR